MTATIYVVIEGGCVRYVSTDSKVEIDVKVIDLDDMNDSPEPDHTLLYTAESLPRIW